MTEGEVAAKRRKKTQRGAKRWDSLLRICFALFATDFLRKGGLWTFVRNRLKAELQNVRWFCDVEELRGLVASNVNSECDMCLSGGTLGTLVRNRLKAELQYVRWVCDVMELRRLVASNIEC